MKKNMFEVLKDILPEEMRVSVLREFSNKYKLCIAYRGMTAVTELPKAIVPGCEIEVCRKAIDNAASSVCINTGNLEEAKAWLNGDMWKSREKALEEKKIEKLYELLHDLKDEKDNEKVAALKWAIFELESMYCKED